jgi:hypothetical protein
VSRESVVCCQVEVSATGRSLVQMSPTRCVVSDCDREVSIMRRFWPSGGGTVGQQQKIGILRNITALN